MSRVRLAGGAIIQIKCLVLNMRMTLFGLPIRNSNSVCVSVCVSVCAPNTFLQSGFVSELPDKAGQGSDPGLVWFS